ncbi:MAG: SDR family NAD(P)-dependent oxidoreductase [Myxococcales bacterium]|nr:SDR family NAD(P)-dependent oxidoreductase [Myxococcales bacterium]
MPLTDQVALVTGGNRGLGLETCRQLAARGFRVVLSARSAEAANRAAAQLGVESLALDVADPASIASARAELEARYRRLDVLVNNAGVSLSGFDGEIARRTLAVNLFGAIDVTEALVPLLGRGSRIVMVSSGMGELSAFSPARRRELESPDLTREGLRELVLRFLRAAEEGQVEAGGWPRSAYRVSKAGLNAFTRILAVELAEAGVIVNAVCPGWVRTDMGGSAAPRSLETGGESIVWAATLAVDGPSGGFYRDGRRIAW